MVFNTTFNNISVISWWSVLLMEETRVSGENHRPAASDWQTLSHNVVLSTPERDSNSQLPGDHDHDGAYEYDVEILYYRNKTLFLHCGILHIW